jgi:hypothetical protein
MYTLSVYGLMSPFKFEQLGVEDFTTLELCYGLDINNINHIWLLHLLFLITFNQQFSFLQSYGANTT